MPLLPLFPLGTVLLPGAKLPLQVFEPRYLALVRDLQERPLPERHFGVVAIRSGHEVGAGSVRSLYETGTAAHVDAVTLADSSAPLLHLLATGTRRFSLDGVDGQAGTPYLTGSVTWLDDGASGPGDEDLLAALLDEVAAYRSLLGAPPVHVGGDDPGALVFAATDAVRLALADRQQVLEAPDVASRLRVALRLVRRERALLERLGSVHHPADLGAAGLN